MSLASFVGWSEHFPSPSRPLKLQQKENKNKKKIREMIKRIQEEKHGGKLSARKKAVVCMFCSWKIKEFVVSFFYLKLLIMIKLLGYTYMMKLEAEFK